MSSNKNPVSMDTLNNNVKKYNVIAYAILVLICIMVGVSVAMTGGLAFIAVGVAIGAGGGWTAGNAAYNMLVDPRNERKCDVKLFNKYSWMRIPDPYYDGEADIDSALDISERDALIKVIYEGYGGVYLKSNTASDSIGGNFDAWFIPGNAKATMTQRGTSAPTRTDRFADRLYLIKKGDYKVIAKDKTKDDKPVISPIPTDGTAGMSPTFVSDCELPDTSS